MKNHFLPLIFSFLWFSLTGQWTPTDGPWGGTINQFYETQETLFSVTGSGAGGVFKSLDGGQSWEICNKGLPLTSKLPAIYGDQEYLYVGLWLQGIYRSDDMGNTWSESSNGISEFGLSINAIHATAGKVWAGSQIDGMYVSDDHGDNWVLKSNGLDGAARRIAAITNLGAELFVATPLGVYKSDDDGDNWVASSNGIPIDKVYSFDIITKDNLLFVCALDGIYRSNDNGENWVMLDGDFTTGVYTITASGDNLYTGSNGKVYGSADDGESWTEIGTGLPEYSYIYAIHASDSELICGLNMYGVYSHNLDNDVWSTTNHGVINRRVTDLEVDGNTMFAVTLLSDFGHIYKTDNNGADWYLSNDGAWIGGYHALMNAGSYLLAGSDGGFIFRSTNHGENWENIKYPDFPSSYVSSFCEKDGVPFAGSFGNVIGVYRSLDNGDTWTNCNVAGQGNIQCMYTNSDYVFTGRTEGVFRSMDLGVSWTRSSDGMTATPFVSSIGSNANYLFAAAIDGLYRSSNNGDDWEKIYTTSPPNLQIKCISTNDDLIFIGTPVTGLLFSEDDGNSWEAFNPEYFQDPNGIIPTVLAGEIVGDSIYVSYENYSVWVSPLPNLTGTEDDNNESISRLKSSFKVYPNPARDFSTVSYSLSTDTKVSVRVFDLMGKEKQTLVDTYQTEGDYHAVFNANKLDKGIYIIGMKIGNRYSSQRIIITD